MKTAKEIIERATNDPEYAKSLKEAARAAAEGGVTSAEHQELLKHFVADEDELEGLQSESGPVEFGFTTTTTVTTYSTVACTTTTITTLTTGN